MNRIIILGLLLVVSVACEQVGAKRDDAGGAGGAGGLDAGSAGGSGGAGGGMSADAGDTGGSGGMGGMGGSAGDAGTDATDTGTDARPLGSACMVATDCGSGFCVGVPGRCCDSACPGPCNACGTGYCEVANEGKSCAAATCDGDPTPSMSGTGDRGCVAANSTCKAGVCVTMMFDCCKVVLCCGAMDGAGTCKAGCNNNLGLRAGCNPLYPVQYTACTSGTTCKIDTPVSAPVNGPNYPGTCK